MKKAIYFLIILLFNFNICFANDKICFDGNCYQEVYRYPQFGFYAFVTQENKNTNYNSYYSEPPIAKLARLYPFDNNMRGKLLVAYVNMPNVNAFKNAPKTNLGSLENVARSQGTAAGHLSVNLPESGYIDHTTFIINNGKIYPMKKYREWAR